MRRVYPRTFHEAMASPVRTPCRIVTAALAAVVVALTVTEPVAAGYTTAYPCLEGRPTASNNNYAKDQTIPNFVAVRPDATGDICVYTSNSAVRFYDTRAPRSFR
jgi:hypothetical protein